MKRLSLCFVTVLLVCSSLQAMYSIDYVPTDATTDTAKKLKTKIGEKLKRENCALVAEIEQFIRVASKKNEPEKRAILRSLNVALSNFQDSPRDLWSYWVGKIIADDDELANFAVYILSWYLESCKPLVLVKEDFMQALTPVWKNPGSVVDVGQAGSHIDLIKLAGFLNKLQIKKYISGEEAFALILNNASYFCDIEEGWYCALSEQVVGCAIINRWINELLDRDKLSVIRDKTDLKGYSELFFLYNDRLFSCIVPISGVIYRRLNLYVEKPKKEYKFNVYSQQSKKDSLAHYVQGSIWGGRLVEERQQTDSGDGTVLKKTKKKKSQYDREMNEYLQWLACGDLPILETLVIDGKAQRYVHEASFENEQGLLSRIVDHSLSLLDSSGEESEHLLDESIHPSTIVKQQSVDSLGRIDTDEYYLAEKDEAADELVGGMQVDGNELANSSNSDRYSSDGSDSGGLGGCVVS